MDISVSHLDKVAHSESDLLIEIFSQCIHGPLNNTAIGFLKTIAKFNPAGLKKLTTKLQQLQCHIDAKHIDFIIKTLTEQLNLPHQTMNTIQIFLQNKSKQNIIAELKALSNHKSQPLESILQVMTNLKLFADDIAEHQFLRLIISIMIQWNTEQKGRTCQDAAQWLKSVLNIPHKTEMAQIIKLIADQLYLSECQIDGQLRHTDCLELFFLVENTTTHTEIALVSDANKQLMIDIQAVALIAFICKHFPNAFYDVVTLQVVPQTPSSLNVFLQRHDFEPYFQFKDQNNTQNHSIFLNTLITQIHKLLCSEQDQPIEKLQQLNEFLALCQLKKNEMEEQAFTAWFEKGSMTYQLEPIFQAIVLETVYQSALSKKSRHTGRVRASALQLVSLGFSHRSISTQTTGVFQPMVNTEIADRDEANIKAFHAFYNQQSPDIRLKIAQELLHLTVTTAQNKISDNQDFIYCLKKATTPNFKKSNKTHANYIVPKMSRYNPVQRERLFTPKGTSAKSIEKNKTHTKYRAY